MPCTGPTGMTVGCVWPCLAASTGVKVKRCSSSSSSSEARVSSLANALGPAASTPYLAQQRQDHARLEQRKVLAQAVAGALDEGHKLQGSTQTRAGCELQLNHALHAAAHQLPPLSHHKRPVVLIKLVVFPARHEPLWPPGSRVLVEVVHALAPDRMRCFSALPAALPTVERSRQSAPALPSPGGGR